MTESSEDTVDAKRGSAPAETEQAAPRIPRERYDLMILQALRKVIRGVDIYSRSLISSHDVTAPQLICLITIAGEGTLSLKQIAERVFLSPSTVVGILDRLEAKGLVLRARDTRDRRLVNVTVTPRGHELIENAPSPLQESLARSLKELPEIEQATIALSLQRLVDLMNVEGLEAAPVLDTGASLADGNDDGDDTEEARAKKPSDDSRGVD